MKTASSLSVRLWITAAFLLSSTLVLRGLSHGEPKLLRQPLANFPLALAEWHGNELPMTDRMVQAAGVDDYVNRIYSVGQQLPVGLYIGYYGTQRTGDTIHSPKNCLPGSGWEPVRSGYVTVALPDGSSIKVNQYLVAKGADKRLVLYWYQGRGRVVASEYEGKAWMVIDAIRLHRTDGALVRLVTPVDDGEASAQQRLVRFVGRLYPQLNQFIPN
jgi:EpsI family protein